MSLYEQAQKLVHNDKRESYGPMYESFNKIAAIWSCILNIPIDAKQVALCMLGMKLSRESNKHQEDNIVDFYGYCICLEGIIKEENKDGYVYNCGKHGQWYSKTITKDCPACVKENEITPQEIKDEMTRVKEEQERIRNNPPKWMKDALASVSITTVKENLNVATDVSEV